jgi:hypothetical protein
MASQQGANAHNVSACEFRYYGAALGELLRFMSGIAKLGSWERSLALDAQFLVLMTLRK